MSWSEICKIDFKKQVDHKKEQGLSVRKSLKILAEESGIPIGTLKGWLYPESTERARRKYIEGVPQKRNAKKKPRKISSPNAITNKEYINALDAIIAICPQTPPENINVDITQEIKQKVTTLIRRLAPFIPNFSWSPEMAARRKKVVQARSKSGLCIYCDSKTSGRHILCDRHLKIKRENQRAIRLERKANGLCPSCGDPVAEGLNRCRKCYERKRIANKRYQHKRKKT